MASTINKIRGRAYRTLVDNTQGAFIWNQLSFWTHAQDVEFNDGENAQQKVGDIHGITTSTSVTTQGYAVDATVIASLNKRVNQKLSATLSRGSTSLTFTNSSFTNSTHFDFYCSTYGVVPKTAVLEGTTLRLTFKEQSSSVAVEVYYFNP